MNTAVFGVHVLSKSQAKHVNSTILDLEWPLCATAVPPFWTKECISFLRYIISLNGVLMVKAMVVAVALLPCPKSVKELQYFWASSTSINASLGPSVSLLSPLCLSSEVAWCGSQSLTCNSIFIFMHHRNLEYCALHRMYLNPRLACCYLQVSILTSPTHQFLKILKLMHWPSLYVSWELSSVQNLGAADSLTTGYQSNGQVEQANQDRQFLLLQSTSSRPVPPGWSMPKTPTNSPVGDNWFQYLEIWIRM